MEYWIEMDTICGKLAIAEDGTGITHVGFDTDSFSREPSRRNHRETDLLKQARRQLSEYFNGTRKEFTLPLSMKGTPFQVQVWNALLEIPYGETRSYKEIAQAVQSPNACRAVGMANHNNPIGIVVPCHRVIGSDGSMTGYAGGLDIKKKLLELERNGSSAV